MSAVKTDQLEGIPGAGIPEQAVKKTLTGSAALSLPSPFAFYRALFLNSRFPHYLGAWNRLVHWELWIRSQPPRYYFTQLKEIDGESQLGFRVPKGYCWKYHKGLQCVGCNFKHSCPLCEKNHYMMSCQNFRPSKGKPVAANTTTLNTIKSKPS